MTVFCAIALHEVVRKFRGNGRVPRAGFSAGRFFARDTVRTKSSVLLPHTNISPKLHRSRADLAAMTTSYRRTQHRSHPTINAASPPDHARHHRHRSPARPHCFVPAPNPK